MKVSALDLAMLTPLLAGCVAPGDRKHADHCVPDSRARVHSSAGSEELARIVAEIEPRVIAELGTSWPRSYVVRIGPTSGDWNAETRERDRRVTIAPGKVEAWRVAHELVHVHATGAWANLPGAVEEGLAYLVGARVTGVQLELEEPTPEAFRRALTIEYQEYLALDELERREMNLAAVWIAAQLLKSAPSSTTGSTP